MNPDSRLASLPRRLACLGYEALLLLAVLFLAFLVPQVVLSLVQGRPASPGLMWIHVTLVSAGYFLWFWSHGGQTLAMKTWKIRLTGPERAAPSLGRLLLRFALVWPSVLCLGLGLAWALVDPERQFLHDRLAGTRLSCDLP